MASSDSSFLRLDPTQRSLLTGLQHDQLINLQNLYNVHLELSKEGSPTLQITGSNHAEALAAVQELISSKRTKNETGTNFASSTPTHVHYGLSRDDSESNIESTLVDVIDLPNDDQMEVLGAEEDEVSASEEDNGAEQHEDMWESVEVDSEFEGLSEEDLYGDMEVDLETVDEKPIENPSEDDSGLGGMRHHRTHHGNGGNVGQEANQAMIDALSPYVGKETMNSKTMDSDEDFVSDEEEAAYETKVERYNRYRQLNESQRTGMESDESDEDEDEDHMNRPARTRRPRKVSLAQSPATKVRSSISTRAKRTTSRVDSEEEDESDYDYSGPSARLRERSKLRDRGELSKDVEQLRLAVEKEFDVALDAKRKELELIETRMDEARALWERLQAVWSQRTWVENIVAPRVQAVAEFRNSKKRGRPLSRDHLTTARQIKEQSEALEVLVRKLHDRAPPKKRKKTEPSVARPLFCLTPNRGFVQVICPNCGRDMFGSHLGFINHCRLVHLVKFSSWDDAVELCGQPVDDSVVPMDDPARKESTSLGFSISLQKRESQTFRPPSGTFPASHPSSHNQSHALASANQDASIRGGVTIDHSKMPILTPGEHNIHNTDNSRFYIKKQVIIGNSYKSLSTLNVREENEAEAAWMRPANDPSPPTHRWMVYIRPIHNDNEDLSNFIAKVRFYLHPAFKPRDIVEITKPPFQLIRESGHAWPVRIQVFFQDPRNKPMSFVHYVVLQQSLVEAVGEEYYADLEIDREFTEGMAVEDAKTNAAFSPSGTQAFSRETQQQRYQQYLDSNSGSNAVQGAVQGAGRPNSEDMYLSDSAPSNRSARHTARQMGGYASHSATSTMAFDEPSITYDMLVDFVRHTASTTCPLICTDPTLFLPYSAAKSHAEWCGWTYGKRKSSEWQRAMRISRLLYERYQVKRTTRELLDLCKHLNLTPTDDEPYNQHHPNGTESLIPGDPNAPSVPVISNYSRSYFLPGLRQRLERLEIGDATQMSQVMRYCRFCGSAHFPLDRIDELEIECGEHKLLILQESHSTFRELVERSVRQVHHFNESEQRLVLVLQQQLQVQSETPADTTMESQIIDNFNSASRPPKPLPTVGTYPTIAKKPLSNPSGADAPTDHEKTQDLYIAAALAAKYQSNQALMDIDASSIQVDLPAEGMSKADSRRYTKVNGLASPVRTKYPKPSKAAENRQLATPNRRGRPAKVSKHGALAPLLGAGSPAETPSTTPSKAIKDHAIPTTWQFGSVTEDSSTWTLEALCALPPVEFISFMTLISPSQHSLLPNLPAERLTILTDFLAESAKQPASSTTASSSSTPSATYAPNDEFVDVVGGQDTMQMDISRDSTAPTSPSPASKKQAPAVTKASTGSNKPVKLGLQPSKTKKASSTESSTSAAPNQVISDNIQGVESETSRGADAVGMEGDYNQETSNSVSPSSHPASTSQNQQNAGQKSTAERKEQAAGSTKEDKKASTNASNDDSDWTPAQLNIIITYWKENPDKKSAPLPPHILEALLAAGETANSDSAIKSEPVPKAEAYTPSKVDKPKQTPRKRSVKKEKPLVAVASPGTPLTPLIPASVVQPKESPNPMSMDVSPTFSSDARKPPSKRSEYTETLRSTKVEHLEFRPLEQPSADAVPELQEQLNILQLDHATSNHANMILLKLMGSFARRLLFASAEAHALEKANESVEEARFKVMVPLHVATAVINDPQQFDFLTDEGLARYTSLEMIGANALTDDPSAQDILAQLEHRLKLHRIMAENDTAAAAATATSTTQGTTNTSSTQNEEANV